MDLGNLTKKLVGSGISLVSIAGVFACGYTFQGSGSILPADVKTVSIRLAENDTTVPGLGPRFTEKLRSRFERYGVVKVLDAGEEADAELITKIDNIDIRTRDVTGNADIALELELIMNVTAELRRRNGQILYRNTVNANETFAGVSDVVVTSNSSFAQGGIGSQTLGSLGSREVSRGQQDQALEDVMDEAARKLYLDAVAAEF